MSYAGAELEKLFEAGTPVEALRQIIPNLGKDFSITDLNKWTRGGGESYILPFEVKSEDTEFQGIFKASTSITPEITINNAINRRKLLSKYGVKTPKLHGHGNGVVLEEFLPYTLEEAHEKFRNTILNDIAYAYGVISAQGFQPVVNGTLRDFRGDEHGNMCLIDFGADLGSPNDIPTDLWESFSKEVQTRLGIDRYIVQDIRTSYNNGLNSKANVPKIRLTT